MSKLLTDTDAHAMQIKGSVWVVWHCKCMHSCVCWKLNKSEMQEANFTVSINTGNGQLRKKLVHDVHVACAQYSMQLTADRVCTLALGKYICSK